MKSETHVYLVAEEGTAFIKIGVAERPNIRIGGLQTGNPRRLSLHVTYPFPTREQAVLAESRLHKRFSANQTVGEWFLLDIEDAHQFLGLVWREIVGCEKVERPKPRLVVANGV